MDVLELFTLFERKLKMKGKISAVFLISILSTKSTIFDSFASPYIAFAKRLKTAIFHTFKNRAILPPIYGFFEVFLPCSKI